MNSRKKISTEALLNLIDALSYIYWFKDDLQKFIELTISNKPIVFSMDWTKNKKDIVTQLITKMSDNAIYLDDLLLLIDAICNFTDFEKLKKSACPNPEEQIKKAKKSISHLKNQSQGFFEQMQEVNLQKQAKVNHQNKIEKHINNEAGINELKQLFLHLTMIESAHERGFKFEKFLTQLFNFFNLDAKGPFKIIGEQIDGAFTHDSTDYLIEAKWQKTPINLQDIHGLAGKITNKLKGTLGLYISMNGYSTEALKANSNLLKLTILMDGEDLMHILENRISLNTLLYKKRRHASETGNIYYKDYLKE